MGKRSCINRRCGNCLQIDKDDKRCSGLIVGYFCKKKKQVKAVGAVAPGDCFEINVNAKKFYTHI